MVTLPLYLQVTVFISDKKHFLPGIEVIYTYQPFSQIDALEELDLNLLCNSPSMEQWKDCFGYQIYLSRNVIMLHTGCFGYSFLSLFNKKYLFEKQWDRERERCSIFWFTPPNGNNSLGKDGLKPGSRTWFHVSLVGSRAIFCCFF